jgi:hypothetical protein
MVSHRDGRKTSLKGDTFITSLIFLFVLIGTLRLCCMKTMHEAKLAAIFVQETQGFYLLENLMALARDYVYQIVQNPKEPHLFLGPNAFRTQDKLNCKAGAYVIDFNGSLSKEQIVPEDFPLKIQDEGWEIKGGPIFWKDNKKNSNDERYLSEVFMLGTLKLDSKLIPDWTIHTVQTMEIEKNPLCDFQLYTEGDTTLTTNINGFIGPGWATTMEGPVQINGNARFSHSNGSENNKITFKNKFNCAGYALRLTGTSLENYKLPEKYHMYDNSTNNKKASDKEGTILNTYFFKDTELTKWHNTSITGSGGTTSTTETKASDISYEREIFQKFLGKFNTRFRIYRPMGFDPSGYWGFWKTGSFEIDDGIDTEKQVLNFCFGFHNLAQNSSRYAPGLYNNPNDKILAAAKELQGLNSYQMTEKLRLIEMQKPTNFPGVHIYIKQKNKKESSNSLSVPNNFVFSTYIDDAFPPSKDNVFLNRYLNLAFQNNSVIDDSSYIEYSFNKQQNETYHFDLDALPRYIQSLSMYMNISKNKYACHSLGKGKEKDGYIDSNSYNIVKIKSEFSPKNHNDDSCPPHKITEKSTEWYLNENCMTRITGEHYNFLYDRNRAKWIQIVDIDVQQLTTWLNGKSDYGSSILPIVTINSEGTIYPNKNYKYGANDKDIRINYSGNRKDFFSNNRYESYKDTTSVIDIGVRLINAETLPDKGMTFCCPYPLYIKGNFNTASQKPALIVADSITILPSDWQDWRSQTDPINSPLWYHSTKKIYQVHPPIKGPAIYADIITGRTHPNYWIQSPDTDQKIYEQQTQAPNPDNGIHDAFRSLCDFSSRIEFYGSLMLPYFCQEQWEPPINFCKTTTIDPKNYAYPPLNMHLWKSSSIPAGMPFYHRINRGRKTHSIGDVAYGVLSGETLYKKNWVVQGAGTEEIEANALSLPDYHEALPNYLKYETTPK